jgi:hypothetical protein
MKIGSIFCVPPRTTLIEIPSISNFVWFGGSFHLTGLMPMLCCIGFVFCNVPIPLQLPYHGFGGQSIARDPNPAIMSTAVLGSPV